MDNITVIKRKTLAKQRGIKGYYKLRKAELMQKLEAHPDVNEQVLISGKYPETVRCLAVIYVSSH